MRRITTSAADRIAFTSSAIFAFAILLLGVAVYFAADSAFRRQQDAGIAEENAALLREFGEGGLPDLRKAIAKRQAGRAISAYGFAVFDRRGNRIAGALVAAMPRLGYSDIVFIDPVEGDDPARALATALPGGYRLVVARDPEGLERIDTTILALFGGAFVLVIVLGAAGAATLGSYLRSRLGRISDAAQAIIAGDLERRVPVGTRHDEFDRLALSLNAMLDRIAQLLDNLRQVSSDVAHDLRTPLTGLRNGLDQALDGPRDMAGHRAVLKRAIRQSDHLLTLFAAILRISEVEAGSIQRTFVRVDLGDLVRDLCESYAPAVTDGGRTLVWSVAKSLPIAGDRELLAQSLINLLDNAQRHTLTGTRIAVAADRLDDAIRLSIADDGPGVAPEDRERIVRRFGRLDASRTTAGHGLGLNLVVAIASAHGGAVAIDDAGPGLRVTLVLPAIAA